MLEKILTAAFRKQLQLTFADIQAQQDRSDEREFSKDEPRIREQLLDRVDTYPKDSILDEDFLIAAVDGSGSDNLSTMDDIRIHLLSTAIVLVDTCTREEHVFRPLNNAETERILDQAQPHLDTHWHSGVKQDARNKMAEFIEERIPLKNTADLVMSFFRDFTRGKGHEVREFSDLFGTRWEKYRPELSSTRRLISRTQLSNAAIHEELRTVSEYCAARRVLSSGLKPKYLLLDGAMSIFMHPGRNYPSMASGFILREMCSLARKEGVVLCAVSKNHTIPFAHRIAKVAEDMFGPSSKWFCHLPSGDDPGGDLNITRNRAYVPPVLAVPYLFSFSGDNRPSRIDFDRIWWLDNILVPNDPITTRENEKALFRDIEFMSRDARWYGYPVPLALAHQDCKLSYQDLLLAREICWDVRKEMGLDNRRMNPLRDDLGI